jgi:hypothetical protein
VFELCGKIIAVSEQSFSRYILCYELLILGGFKAHTEGQLSLGDSETTCAWLLPIYRRSYMI